MRPADALRKQVPREDEDERHCQDSGCERRQPDRPALGAEKLHRTAHHQAVQNVVIRGGVGGNDALIGLRRKGLQGVRFVVSEAASQGQKTQHACQDHSGDQQNRVGMPQKEHVPNIPTAGPPDW